jgi:secondary thiamine-phosphate synthase enzyme
MTTDFSRGGAGGAAFVRTTTLTLETSGPGFSDLSVQLEDWLREIGAETGLATLYLRHTSASLTIQENAEPDVQRDLVSALERLAPEDLPYRHCREGADDMPAQIKALLTATHLSIPVAEGRPLLGTWQSPYLVEHRRAPRSRELVMTFLGTLQR